MKGSHFNRLLNNHLTQYRFSAALVICSYLILYYVFLKWTHFLPYGFDNNETFSSLIHAQNLFHFGIKSSFGLTEEAYGFLNAAHPYVYTHQGNFPRFYTFLLYALGIRSVEWHIGITTFTIGLAGIIFCFHYFAKHVSCLFAVIFCLLLMTDYVMFMQWQVSVWRVWHLFFFFASFLCCHGLIGKRRRFFIPATLLNFACLFYMETSYATFVFMSCVVYLLFFKISWKQKFANFLFMSLGMFFGMFLLIAQDIAYLGWNTFLKDFMYTFLSRNQMTLTNQNAENQIMAFYAKNKVIFWANFNNVISLRNPLVMIQSFYRFCLLPYTPLLTLSAFLVFMGTSLSYMQQVWRKNSKAKLYFPQISPNALFVLKNILFLVSIFALLLVSYPSNWDIKKSFFEFMRPFSFGFFCFSALTFVFFSQSLRTKAIDLKAAKIKDSMSIMFFCLLICMCAIFFQLDQGSGPVVDNLQVQSYLSSTGASGLTPLIAMLIIFSSPLYSYSQKNRVKELRTFKKILPFIAATSAGFICSYLVFPGYIRTAYFIRYCCFSVFAHMALYAWLFYRLSMPAFDFFRQKIRQYEPLGYLNLASSIADTRYFLKLTLSCFLLYFFTYSWFHVQAFYLGEFSPRNFQFIKVFKESFFHKKSIVSNTYAAPFSFVGETWAYLDPAFPYSELVGKNPRDLSKYNRDLSYLWFADAKENPRYQRPTLFVCWLAYYSIEQLGHPRPKCGDFPLIRDIRNHKNKDLIELIQDKSGKDQWSIVALPAFIKDNNFLLGGNMGSDFILAPTSIFIFSRLVNNLNPYNYKHYFMLSQRIEPEKFGFSLGFAKSHLSALLKKAELSQLS